MRFAEESRWEKSGIDCEKKRQEPSHPWPLSAELIQSARITSALGRIKRAAWSRRWPMALLVSRVRSLLHKRRAVLEFDKSRRVFVEIESAETSPSPWYTRQKGHCFCLIRIDGALSARANIDSSTANLVRRAITLSFPSPESLLMNFSDFSLNLGDLGEEDVWLMKMWLMVFGIVVFSGLIGLSLCNLCGYWAQLRSCYVPEYFDRKTVEMMRT